MILCHTIFVPSKWMMGIAICLHGIIVAITLISEFEIVFFYSELHEQKSYWYSIIDIIC